MENTQLDDLRVTIAHAPMVGAKDYDLAWCGQSLLEIAEGAIARGVVPTRFCSRLRDVREWHGRITIDSAMVPAEHWHLVRPKPGRRVHLWIPPQEALSLGLGVGQLLFSIGAPVALTNAAIAATTFLAPLALGFVAQTDELKLFGDRT